MLTFSSLLINTDQYRMTRSTHQEESRISMRHAFLPKKIFLEKEMLTSDKDHKFQKDDSEEHINKNQEYRCATYVLAKKIFPEKEMLTSDMDKKNKCTNKYKCPNSNPPLV